MGFARTHPLLLFFLLAFGISWGIPGVVLLLATGTGAFEVSLEAYSPLSYVALWAPAVAAFAVIGITRGRDGVRAYARRLLHWDVGWHWYLAVLLGIPLLNLVAALGMESLGHDAIVVPTISAGAVVVSAILRATEGPMEELGWRGFALPMLQQRLSGLGASVTLGAIWALWHVPALVIGRAVGGGVSGGMTYVLLVFFAVLIAQSVLLTVVYNGTSGSIPLAMLFHWMTNWPYPWETGLDLSPVAGPLWIAVAVLVALTVGRRYMGLDNLCNEVIPGFPTSRSEGK